MTGPYQENVILVDEQNRNLGAAEKMDAHRRGLLHRAFSIFLTDPDGKLILQQRHGGKYHSGGLWANACCGHPRPGERTLAAANRRLGEELGVASRLTLAFTARYRLMLDGGMAENELVYVYFGALADAPRPNAMEVVDLKSVTFDQLQDWSRREPQAIAGWLRHYLAHHAAQMAQLCAPAAAA